MLIGLDQIINQRLLRIYAKSWVRLSEAVLILVDVVVPLAAQQALKYCSKYGHSFVTHINGLEVCTVCHLDEELAVSIHCLEQ